MSDKKPQQQPHTAEPWRLVDYDDIDFPDITIVNEAATFIVATGVSEEDAARIVACVNACQGLPTDLLERGIELYAKADCPLCLSARILWNVRAHDCTGKHNCYATNELSCKCPPQTVCEACFGRGILLVQNDTHGLRFERCDECERFPSDEEALRWMDRRF